MTEPQTATAPPAPQAPAAPLAAGKRGPRNPKPDLVRNGLFLLIHLTPLLAIFTGATAFDWILCISLYFGRMFFVTTAYHRYFSHRTFKTSRAFQAVLAFIAQTSLQRGVLWWAYVHREHHRYSDTWDDPHSKNRYGFWYSHVGWVVDPMFQHTNFDRVRDLTKFKELVWLDKNHVVSPISLAVVVYLVGCLVNGGTWADGWSTLLIGFFLSTVILWHGTYSINSLMHWIGRQRYKTGDESRNSFWLTVLTLGEGWHNNHHHYPSTARQGFFWWEFDPSYYFLKVLSWVGLIWDLRQVPEHVLHAHERQKNPILVAPDQRLNPEAPNA